MSFEFDFFLIYYAYLLFLFLLVGRLQEKTLKQLAIKNHTNNTHWKPFKSRSFCTEPLKMVKSLHDWSSVFYYFFQLSNNNYLNFNEVPFFNRQITSAPTSTTTTRPAHFSLSDQNIYGGMDIVVDFHVQFFVANNYTNRSNIVIFCNRHTLMNL